jgi:ubiquinone/menaquinone biosynthesis C-methylase UbiE
MSEQVNPARIFETLNAHQQSAALRGAIELEVFTHIANGHRTSQALSQVCQADRRGMRILCDYLVVHQFLTKSGDQYGLTADSEAFLDKNSPRYMGGIARFVTSRDQLRAFENVAELVRRGTTQLNQEGTVAQEYDGWVEFARSMVPMMMPAGRFIAELVGKLKPGPIQVLDVAAGHGMFGILVAQANPEARIVALDWANVLEVAVHNAAAAGVQDRYGLLPGSAMSVEFGDGFDVVLMTNFLHHFDRATCELVMHKIRACLKEDGCVITLEFVPNEDRVSPPVPATFSFTMLGSTPAGDAYTFAEYDAMWKAAGFSSSEMQDVPNSPQRVIVTRR